MFRCQREGIKSFVFFSLLDVRIKFPNKPSHFIWDELGSDKVCASGMNMNVAISARVLRPRGSAGCIDLSSFQWVFYVFLGWYFPKAVSPWRPSRLLYTAAPVHPFILKRLRMVLSIPIGCIGWFSSDELPTGWFSSDGLCMLRFSKIFVKGLRRNSEEGRDTNKDEPL